jgi:2-methylcitrate dehydratase
MTLASKLAKFVADRSFEDLSPKDISELKIRILDSLACAIGAFDGEPVQIIQKYLEEMGGIGRCSLIGGGKTSPDRAALYNGALVRYLDFNDSYLAKGETCHPSDNLGAVLAASEFSRLSGKDLMAALAVAYQVHVRLSDVAPVRHRGFDHTTQGSYAVAAGVSKALLLDEERTMNAIAISGTAFNALRVTRTGRISHWKGLAYPNTAFCGTHAAFLARGGITGPSEVFEGNKGFFDSIAGKFEIDWSKEDLSGVGRTIIKKYNAEIHSQPSIEGVLELKEEQGFSAGDVQRIDIEVFDVAYNIIGGGEEGDKWTVETKEEADHSLQYMVAAAILDGTVMPEQYHPERIVRDDVQRLLKKIHVRPRDEFTARFPAEMPTRLIIILRDGRVLEKKKRDYEGFVSRPMTWERVVEKFNRLATPSVPALQRKEIIDITADLESFQVGDLTGVLESIPFEVGRSSHG